MNMESRMTDNSGADGEVKYEVREGIAYITLSRPDKLNALTDGMVLEIQRAFQRFDIDPSAQVAIFHGEGRAFTSGADVRQRQLRPREEMFAFGGPQSPDTKRVMYTVMTETVNWKPVIVAAHGYLLGMGLIIALQCELIVAARSTKLQVTEVSRGIGGSAILELLRHRGAGPFAEEIMLTGRMFTAEEAFQNRLINAVVDEGEHLAVAEDYARQIMQNPPLVVRDTVRVHRWGVDEAWRAARLASDQRHPPLYLSEDFRESALAFAEKRKPRPFQGR